MEKQNIQSFINKVICGECISVMKEIPDKSIDMILADLPYGTTACKWDTIIPFEPLWEQYKRIIKDNGAIVLTASQPFTSKLVASNYRMFKHQWIWNKKQAGNPFIAKIAPLKIFEDIIIFSKKRVNYFPQMINGILRKKGGSKKDNQITGTKATYYSTINNKYYPNAIIEFSTANLRGKYKHPTEKPVALFEYLIKTYTNEGDIVLDNVAGSGTTGVACKNLNRNYILIEKEPEYIEIIKKRLNEETV